MAYIYKITNSVNGKMYVGKTEHTNPLTRWQEHIRTASMEKFGHRPLYFAMNKHGIENFHFEVIEETDNPEEREQFWIAELDTYHNGYNATLGGDGKKYVDEERIVTTFRSLNNCKATSELLGHDDKTVRRVLLKHGLSIPPVGSYVKENASKKVYQIDKVTGIIIATYDSASDAGRATCKGKVKPAIDHIIDVCNGKRKTANGFVWKYVEDMEN